MDGDAGLVHRTPRLRPPRRTLGCGGYRSYDRSAVRARAGQPTIGGWEVRRARPGDPRRHAWSTAPAPGAPGRRGSARGGRVVAIGAVDEPADRSSTPTGSWWPRVSSTCTPTTTPSCSGIPTASPSPLHGVTTVIGGNCGFSLAPSGPDHAEYLARMMARVKGMPLAALEAGLDWSWDVVRRMAGPAGRAGSG